MSKAKIVSINDTDIYEKLELIAIKLFSTNQIREIVKRTDMLFEVAYHALTKLKNTKYVVVYSSQFVVSYITIEDNKLAWHTIPKIATTTKELDGRAVVYKDLITKQNAFDITSEYARNGLDVVRFADYAKHTKAVKDGVEITNFVATCFAFGAFALCIYAYATKNLSEGDVLRINEEHFSIDLKVEGSLAIKLVGYYEINK